jgi:hypothetical protein
LRRLPEHRREYCPRLKEEVELNRISGLHGLSSLLPFFERPVAAVLASMAIGALAWPVLVWVWGKVKPAAAAPAATSR